jgi:hypothetical protein
MMTKSRPTLVQRLAPIRRGLICVMQGDYDASTRLDAATLLGKGRGVEIYPPEDTEEEPPEDAKECDWCVRLGSLRRRTIWGVRLRLCSECGEEWSRLLRTTRRSAATRTCPSGSDPSGEWPPPEEFLVEMVRRRLRQLRSR